MNLKKIPKGFMVTLFVVVFVVYIFQAFKRDFDQRWDTINLGDMKPKVIEILGSPFKETHYVDKQASDSLVTQNTGNNAVSYSYWMVGVEASFIIGFDADEVAVYKYPSKKQKMIQ